MPYLRTWRFGFVYLDDVNFLVDGGWFFRDWRNVPSVFTNDVWEFFGSVVTDPKARDAFAKNMPRPGQNIAYTDEDTLADCS